MTHFTSPWVSLVASVMYKTIKTIGPLSASIRWGAKQLSQASSKHEHWTFRVAAASPISPVQTKTHHKMSSILSEDFVILLDYRSRFTMIFAACTKRQKGQFTNTCKCERINS